MATEKQIAANRRNSQKSTGPRSVEGKAASSRNALKTGLYCPGITIGHELSGQLETLEAQFTAEYLPATPTERSLVDSLIHLEWMLRRYRWLETETWHATQDQLTAAQFESTWSGHAFIAQPAISRIHRLRNSTQRAFHETLAELRALQAERGTSGPFEIPPEPQPKPVHPAPVPSDPDPQLIDIETTYSEIGFVPSNSFDDDIPDPIAAPPISPQSES